VQINAGFFLRHKSISHASMKRHQTKIMFLSLPIALAVTVFGCGPREDVPPTAPVSGSVAYRGRPLRFGRVIFYHSSGHTVGADIAADGRFTLDAYQGDNSVSIECYDYQRPGSTSQRSRTGGDSSLIPVRYLSCGTSGLSVTVKPAGRNDATLELTD
jgi:hypothetical protein